MISEDACYYSLNPPRCLHIVNIEEKNYFVVNSLYLIDMIIINLYVHGFQDVVLMNFISIRWQYDLVMMILR